MAFTGTPMLSRLRVMKVKIEAPKGSYTSPDQAGHVYDLKCEPTADFIERKGTGQYRGPQFQGKHGEKTSKCTFRTELKGTGQHGMDAFCAILLQACGFVKATEAYSVHSNHAVDNTISIAVWEGGKKKMLSGCTGNVRFTGEHGKVMFLECDFDGFWIAPADEAMPTWAPSTRLPLLFDGGALTLALNAIKIGRFALDMGIKPANRSGDYFMVTDYDPVITMDPEEHLVGDYDYHGTWLAGTQAAISLPVTDGTDIITFTCPKAQCKDLKDGDREGLKVLDWTGSCQHSTGNDAVSIAVT